MHRAGQIALGGVIALATAVVLLWIAYLSKAHAHDHNHPELAGWFRSLHSKGGAWCCDGNDADMADWDTSGGRYRVKIDGQWIDVPDDAIVLGPNKAGGARVWTYYTEGRPNVRCFLPDALI
jgi:hypothetical protein